MYQLDCIVYQGHQTAEVVLSYVRNGEFESVMCN